MDGVPSAPPLPPVPRPPLRTPLTRRFVLTAGALTLGTFGAAVTAGCANGGDADHAEEPDPLLTALAAARRDAAAASAAIVVAPERATALGVVAAERGAHADALATEVARAAGLDPSATPSATATTTTTTATPPTVDALRAMLNDSQRGAATLARQLDGYRAGLLGSISAAVAAEQAVMLL